VSKITRLDGRVDRERGKYLAANRKLRILEGQRDEVLRQGGPPEKYLDIRKKVDAALRKLERAERHYNAALQKRSDALSASK